MHKKNQKCSLFLLLFVFFTSCNWQKNKLEAGDWHGYFFWETPADPYRIPFEFAWDFERNDFVLVQGSERLEGHPFRLQEDSVWVDFPLYNTTFIAKIEHDRHVQGVFFDKTAQRRIAHVTLHAGALHYPRTRDNTFKGNWSVYYQGHKQKTALFELTIQQDRLLGGFIAQAHYTPLRGYFFNQEFAVSSFDGGRASLFVAQLEEDGVLRGKYIQTNAEIVDFLAYHDYDKQLPFAQQNLSFASPELPFDFSFVDIDGDTLRRSPEQLYLLQITGTWCPSCYDQTLYLQRLMDDFAHAPLTWVAVYFEQNTATAEARVQAIVQQLQLRNPVVFGGYIQTGVSVFFPRLLNFSAYPTLILLDKKGFVVDFYSGFFPINTPYLSNEFDLNLRQKIQELLQDGHVEKK